MPMWRHFCRGARFAFISPGDYDARRLVALGVCSSPRWHDYRRPARSHTSHENLHMPYDNRAFPAKRISRARVIEE